MPPLFISDFGGHIAATIYATYLNLYPRGDGGDGGGGSIEDVLSSPRRQSKATVIVPIKPTTAHSSGLVKSLLQTTPAKSQYILKPNASCPTQHGVKSKVLWRLQ